MPTNKGELRKLRKQAKADGRDWNIEMNESGHHEIVRTRTKIEEHRHETAMDRWARFNYEND